MTRCKLAAALLLAASTLLAASALGACGTTTSPDNAARAAASKTLAQRTVALSVSLNIPDVVNGATDKPSTGVGTYDLIANRGVYSRLTLYGVPGVPDGNSVIALLQLPTVFAKVNLPAIPTPWVKLDLRVLSNVPGLDLGTITAADGLNPRQFLFFLRGAARPATRVGTEAISGVDTTHYQVSCDLDQAVRGLSGDDATLLRKANASYTSPVVPAQVWVDHNGLLRRLSFNLSVKQRPGKPVRHEAVEFAFAQFGVPVDFSPPPNNQVTDVAGLLQALAGGATGG